MSQGQKAACSQLCSPPPPVQAGEAAALSQITHRPQNAPLVCLGESCLPLHTMWRDEAIRNPPWFEGCGVTAGF